MNIYGDTAPPRRFVAKKRRKKELLQLQESRHEDVSGWALYVVYRSPCVGDINRFSFAAI